MWTGVVRGRHVELDRESTLPDGTLVQVIPVDESLVPDGAHALQEWLAGARELRSSMPVTSDSTEILRVLRDERASR